MQTPAWNDQSLFLYCREISLQSQKSMYKVWFACAPTYGEIQTPPTIQEGRLNVP